MTTIEQDADRIREAFRFFRFPGKLTVSHDNGLACLNIVSEGEIDVDGLWLTISSHRATAGNAAMRIIFNGVLYRVCPYCNVLSAFESLEQEMCENCMKPRSGYKPDPFKEAARRATRKAIREGTVRDEPEACEDCGRTDESLTIHHVDYSDPLNIEWLCTTCHGKRHRGWRKYYAFRNHVEARLAWI